MSAGQRTGRILPGDDRAVRRLPEFTIALRGQDPAQKRRCRRPVRPAGRSAGARGRRVVPRPRLPARRDAHARDLRLDRAARARRQGEGALRHRQDDRGENRPDRRPGGDRGARERAGDRPARGRPPHPRGRARDVIATATDPAALTEWFTQRAWVEEVVARGDTKATVISNDGLRFDLRVVPPESYGNLLQHFTGSKEHNIALREDAVRRGLSISEYGVATVETGDVFHAADEDTLWEFLGYQPIPPELRENAGELDAAR